MDQVSEHGNLLYVCSATSPASNPQPANPAGETASHTHTYVTLMYIVSLHIHTHTETELWTHG